MSGKVSRSSKEKRTKKNVDNTKTEFPVENDGGSNDSSESEEDVEDAMTCPITQEIMEDPVECADGTTYERKAIQAWLKNHDTSPLTNERLKHRRGKLLVKTFFRINFAH